MANKKQNNGSSRFSVKDLSVKEVEGLKMHPLNRGLYESHVNAIVRSFEIGSLETMQPIIINRNTNIVLEGKHRVSAFKKAVEKGVLPKCAKLSALYMSIDKKKEQQYIIDINNRQKRWNGVDYAQSYSNGGTNTQSYKDLLDFCNSHELCHNVAKRSGAKKPKLTYGIMLLNGTTGHGLNAKKIREGKITIDPSIIPPAHQLHEDVRSMISAFHGIGMQVGQTGEKVRDIISVYPRYATRHGIDTWCKALRPRVCAGAADFHSKLHNKPDITVSDWESIFIELDNFINENHIV